MRCPNCASTEDKVTDSRSLASGEAVRRRRECLSCGYRFTSYERIDIKPFMVVKRSGRREPFDRTKIEKGIERALEKRPVSQMNIELLVNEIEDSAAVMGKADHELTSSAIGELVLDKLAILDKAAYIRFASVYKRFESVEEFIAEIKRMKPPEEAEQEASGGC